MFLLWALQLEWGLIQIFTPQYSATYCLPKIPWFCSYLIIILKKYNMDSLQLYNDYITVSIAMDYIWAHLL